MPVILPIALASERIALARMYIELTHALIATIPPLTQPAPAETDANLAVVAAAVMLGHAEGRPMTASEIARCVRAPRVTTMRRLQTLLDNGLIKRSKNRYYLTPLRAKKVPHRDNFNLILARAFSSIGPELSKMDT